MAGLDGNGRGGDLLSQEASVSAIEATRKVDIKSFSVIGDDDHEA